MFASKDNIGLIAKEAEYEQQKIEAMSQRMVPFSLPEHALPSVVSNGAENIVCPDESYS